MSQIQEYKYTLSITNEDVDLTKKESGAFKYDNVELCCDNRTLILYEHDKKILLSLSGLHFVRKVYEPGYIQAEVQVTLVDSDDVPSITILQERFLNKKVTLLLNSTILAKDYYIHEISPLYERNGSATSIYLRLNIYSLDNLMRLDKYSEAFLGKRLCTDILQGNAPDFVLERTIVKDATTNPPTTETKQDAVSVKIEALQHLSKDVNEEAREFIQPYLVQYNETFYDFMARVTNRCGEFLYFEDGKLHVGLSKERLKDVTEIKDYSKLTYQTIKGGILGINQYTHDSRKNSTWDEPNTYVKGRFNTVPWGKESDDDTTKPNPTERVYNAELTADEFFMPLYRDQFSKGEVDELYNDENVGKQIITTLASVLNMTSILDMVVALSTDMANARIQAERSGDKLNDDGNKLIDQYAPLKEEEEEKKYIINDDDLTFDLDKEEEEYNEKEGEKRITGLLAEENSKAVPFARTDASTWTTLSYYNDIRKNEESQQRQIVCADMGSSYADVRLGDAVKFANDDRTFIVVEIDMQSDQPWQRHFDEYGSATPLPAIGSLMKIYAIPALGSVYYPPVLSAPPFRLSEPQHAIITDSNDPNQQGRVRVKYPWQKSCSKSDLKELEGEIETLRKDIDKLRLEKRNAEKQMAKIDKGKIKLEKKKEELENRKKALEAYDEKYMWKHYNKLLSKTKEKNEDKSEWEKEIQKVQDELDGKSNKDNKSIEEQINEIENQYTDEEKQKVDEQQGIIDSKLNGLNGIISKENDLKEKLRVYYYKKLANELCDAATPWIRMVTPMATEGGGMYFKPEKGDEVLVNFEGGNVERPYVVGTLYSKKVLPPKGSRIIKSPNGHYIKMDDTNDGLKFLGSMLPGIKLLQTYNLLEDEKKKWKTTYTEEDKYATDKHLLGGITMTDAYGFYKISMSTHDRKIAISSPLGDVKIDAFTGISISAPNGNVKIVGKNVDITANNRLTITSGKNIKKGLLGSFSLLDPKRRTREKVATDLGGAVSTFFDRMFGNMIDLSFIRSILEVFLRPVNGTLEIKSNSFLLLEAGNGTAEIPSTAYRKRYLERKNMATVNSGYQGLEFLIAVISTSNIADRAKEIARLFNDAATKLAELRSKDDYNNNPPSPNQHENSLFSYKHITNMDDDQFVTACFNNKKYEKLGLVWQNENVKKDSENKVQDAHNTLYKLKAYCDDTATMFETTVRRVHQEVHDLIQDTFTNTMSNQLVSSLDWVAKLFKIKGNQPSAKFADFVDTTHYTPKIVDVKTNTDYQNGIQEFKRCMIYGILNSGINNNNFFKDKKLSVSITQNPINPNANPNANAQYSSGDIITNTDNAWEKYIETLHLTDSNVDYDIPKMVNEFFSSTASNLYNSSRNKLTLFDDFTIDEGQVWNASTKGQILMSDDSSTISFTHAADGNPGLDAFPNTKFSKKTLDDATKHFKKLLINLGK